MLCTSNKWHSAVLENNLLNFRKINQWLLYPRIFLNFYDNLTIHKLGCIKLGWLVNTFHFVWLEVDQAMCPQLGNNCLKFMFISLSTCLVSVICSADANISEMKEHKNRKVFVGLTHMMIYNVLRNSWLCFGISRLWSAVNWVTLLTISHNSLTECPGEPWQPDPVMFINGPITLLVSDRESCFLWNQLGFSSFYTLKNLNWLCIKSKNCLTLWSHVGTLFRVHWMAKATLSLGLVIRMFKAEIP